MSVHSVHGSQAVAQNAAAPQARTAPKQADPKNATPQDKVTISAAAKAKQNAQASRTDGDHDGK